MSTKVSKKMSRKKSFLEAFRFWILMYGANLVNEKKSGHRENSVWNFYLRLEQCKFRNVQKNVHRNVQKLYN